MDRRSFLRSSLASSGFLAFAMRNQAAPLYAASATGKTKRCLVLWMDGGPSQLETFDPKPGMETGGPTKSIASSAPGLHLSELLPKLSQQAHRLTVLRNLTSSEGEHFRANYYLHTGYQQVPGFPRPSLGSVISHCSPFLSVPKNVTLGGKGFGPAFLGLQHAPFSIERPDAALEMLLQLDRKRERLDVIQSLNRSFDQNHPQAKPAQRSEMLRQLQSLNGTPFVKALDTSKETSSRRERYGQGEFAKNCLIARRLLESGVRFVEVRQSGWDTHTNNFAETRELCKQIDQPFATLLQDLESSGLLAETLILWLGEFGRTPIINAARGRDHFPTVTPVVLAGAGLDGGRFIGNTNASGTEIQGNAHSVADLFATIFSALGIPTDTEFTTEFGAPTGLTEQGELIPQVL